MSSPRSTNLLDDNCHDESCLDESNVQNDALNPPSLPSNPSSPAREPSATVDNKFHPFPVIPAEQITNMEVDPNSTHCGAIQVTSDKSSWARGYVLENDGQVSQLTGSRKNDLISSSLVSGLSVDLKTVNTSRSVWFTGVADQI